MKMIILSNKIDERFFTSQGKAFLKKFKQVATPKVEKWVTHYLERYFLSEKFDDVHSMERVYKKEDMPHQFRSYDEKPVFAVSLSPNVYTRFEHIIQYLNSLDMEIPWDVENVISRYEKHITSLKDKEKIREVLKLNDSFEWVQLLDKCAFDRESAIVQHCLSRLDTPHLEDLCSGKYIFLSLRNNNSPHVTLKYNPKSNIIVDLVGKQNESPHEKYYPYIIEIMNYLELKPQAEMAKPFNKFLYKNGKWIIK